MIMVYDYIFSRYNVHLILYGCKKKNTEPSPIVIQTVIPAFNYVLAIQCHTI